MNSWIVNIFTSSIGRKYVMALTGLFLCSFLVVHLGGNLLTLVPDNGATFNWFTHFMSHNILIRTIEIFLFAGFVIHILQSLLIILQNRKARPQKYAVNAGNANSKWYSRNMGVLGTVILIFLVIHIRDFFYESRFTDELVEVNGMQDMFSEVTGAFTSLTYSLIYFFAMFGLGFHLWHGFASAFRSMGIMHNKYTPTIIALGKIYTIVITGGFMFLPLYWYLVQFT